MPSPTSRAVPDSGSPPVRGNEGVTSFSEAKRHLRALYAQAGKGSELYGGCQLEARPAKDGEPPRDIALAARGCCYDGKLELSWEHAVPASVFGHGFVAWTEGDARCVDARGRRFHGRKCATRVSEEFRRMEGDMHNLFPALRALNEARANLHLGFVEGEERRFGSCDFEIDGELVEPRPEVRGELARAYLYMDAAYPRRGIIADDAERALVRAWSAADPPDAWERERNRLIAAIQGNANPFVEL